MDILKFNNQLKVFPRIGFPYATIDSEADLDETFSTLYDITGLDFILVEIESELGTQFDDSQCTPHIYSMPDQQETDPSGQWQDVVEIPNIIFPPIVNGKYYQSFVIPCDGLQKNVWVQFTDWAGNWYSNNLTPTVTISTFK